MQNVTVNKAEVSLQTTTSRTCPYPAVRAKSPVLCGDLWESLSSPATRTERSISSVPRLVPHWEHVGVKQQQLVLGAAEVVVASTGTTGSLKAPEQL